MNVFECSVSECKAGVAISQLMCRRHWALVPDDLRRDVYAKYRAYRRDRSDVALDRLRGAQDAATHAVEASA